MGSKASKPAAAPTGELLPHPHDTFFPAAVVDEVGQAVDTFMRTSEAVRTNESLSDFVTRTIPSLGTVIGEIGQNAPMIGIVFSVLKMAGKQITDTSKTRCDYEEFNNAIRTTCYLVMKTTQTAPKNGLNDNVKTALGLFWDQIGAFVQLLVRFRGQENYLTCLWNQSGNAKALQTIQMNIKRARQDLHTVLQLRTHIVVEGLQEKLRRPQQDQIVTWVVLRKRHYQPLRNAARALKKRLNHLKNIYFRDSQSHQDSLSADFREILMLSRAPIPNLNHVQPHLVRQNDKGAVDFVRVRMAHDLGFAISCLYDTAEYLALARSTNYLLTVAGHNLPDDVAKELWQRIDDVADAFEGRIFEINRGVLRQVQNAIGEIMAPDRERPIVMGTNEFRERLLEAQGWEQFLALLKFFVTDGVPDGANLQNKLQHEGRAMVQALTNLKQLLDRIAIGELPPKIRASDVPKSSENPWPNI